MRSHGPIAGMLALLLVSCSASKEKEGRIYLRPAADVRAVILATDLPFPLQGTRHAAVQARRMPDGGIELALADEEGRPQMRFLAGITDLGHAKTRVVLSYAGAGAAYGAVDKGMAAHPEIEALYLKTMREQVDAELEGRPFNNLAIGREIATAFVANAGAISRQMQAAGDEFRRRDRENIERAYAEEARGER